MSIEIQSWEDMSREYHSHYIRNFFLRIKWKFEKWWSYLQQRFWYKDHIICLGKPGYREIEVKLEECFERLIIDFIEVQKPFERHDWNYTPDISAVKKDLVEAYNWYKVEKPLMLSEIDKIHNEIRATTPKHSLFVPETRSLYDKVHKLDDEFKKKQTEVMIKMVKIRDCLWT